MGETNTKRIAKHHAYHVYVIHRSESIHKYRTLVFIVYVNGNAGEAGPAFPALPPSLQRQRVFPHSAFPRRVSPTLCYLSLRSIPHVPRSPLAPWIRIGLVYLLTNILISIVQFIINVWTLIESVSNTDVTNYKIRQWFCVILFIWSP